jgi:hypothetical protein
MSLADGKFVNADVPHTPYVRIPVSGFQSSFMNVLYRIPSQMKIFCHGFDGGDIQQIHDKIL